MDIQCKVKHSSSFSTTKSSYLDYENMQMSSHDYFNNTRRSTRGGRNSRIQDLSSGYYYEHPQQYKI